jgi:hypothetical protein
MYLLKKNMYHVIPFTFEQITENPEKSFSIFLGECGHKDNFYFPNVEINEKDLINEAMNKKQTFLPSSKSLDLYLDIQEYVKSSGVLDVLVEEYTRCKYAIYMRQLEF